MASETLRPYLGGHHHSSSSCSDDVKHNKKNFRRFLIVETIPRLKDDVKRLLELLHFLTV